MFKKMNQEILNQALLNKEVNRRHFLLGSAAAAVGAYLGPWSPNAFAAEPGKIGGRLDVMAWEGYTLQEELASWLRKNGIQENAAIMSNQDDVTAKLVGSPVRLDLAEYSNGYNEIYKSLNVLKPIDVSKIPNYNQTDIIPQFYDGKMWYWDGKRFGIPWVWGLDTAVYNPAMVKDEVTSLQDFLRPEFKGKLTFINNPLTTWPMIAKATGYGDKFPAITKDELKDIFEKMRPYREQCKTFASSNGDVISLFAAGEISACFTVWSAVPLETKKKGVITKAADLKEGGSLWADAWFVPATSENIDTALAFINMALEPGIQASIAKTAVAGTVSKKAVPLLDPVTKSLFDYNDIQAVLTKNQLKGQPPRESEQYATYDDWLQAWSDFQAGF